MREKFEEIKNILKDVIKKLEEMENLIVEERELVEENG